ncbi:MAG TPA: NlpC/P60 family protein, partial [Solirubrobacteraceae bacterium]|nr:NlpC/P60 family protein [Solirubrobacteraceae bacterium]
MSSADEQTQKAGKLIERLLVDAPFRAAFRKDPVGACRQLGLEDLAAELGQSAGKAMHTLEVRESKSSLAGVVMAVAAEGIGVVELHGLVEHGLLHGNMRAAGEQALRGVNPMHPASSLHSELRAENPLSGASRNPVAAAECAEALAREQAQQSGGTPGSGSAAGAPASGSAAGAAAVPGGSSAAESAAGTASPGGAAAANAPVAGAAAAGSAAHGAAEASTAAPGGAHSSVATSAPSAASAQPASGGAAWPAEPAAPTAAPGVAEVPSTGAVSPEVAGTPAAAPYVAEVPNAGVGDAVAEPGAVAGAPTVYPAAAGVYPAVVPSAGAGAGAGASAQELVGGGAVAGHASAAAAEAAAAAHDPSWGSPKAHDAYEIAKSELGVPYLWGGTSPKTGFDCSGLVQYAYGRAGIHIPRVAAEQFDVGTPVGLHQLREGDLVFFKEPNGYIHHVGIYVGDYKFIQAPCTGQNVDYGDLREPYFAQQFAGGRRIVPLSAPPPALAPQVPAVAATPAVAAEPAAFQAETQPAGGTPGAVPIAVTGAAPPEAATDAAPSVAVTGAAPPEAVAEPAVVAPEVPVASAAEAAPAVPGAVPAAGQEISPGVHLYGEPLPSEPPPQPGTAVFKALQAQESSYLRHTVQFLQAVPPPSAEPASAAAAPDAVVQAPGEPAGAAEVAGQSPVAGTGAPGEAVAGATPGV